MARNTLEPRKTTWVKFIDEKAKMDVERKCKVYYYTGNILSNLTHNVDMKYLFTNLKSGKCIPSSQLIIKENGIPVTITNTVVSLDPTKFTSATTEDPFVEISDNVASVDKTKVKEKKLSKRIIEREWEEIVTRVVKVENKTGKKINLDMSVFENPADGIIFKEATPKPSRSTPPERGWMIDLKKEQDKTISIQFVVKRKESIRLPPDKTGKVYDDQLDEMDYPVEESEFAEELQTQQVMDLNQLKKG